MEFINRLIGALFRIVLMLTGLVFVAGLMLLAITALALSLLWSLITGKRHPVTMVWSRFRQTQDAVWRASQGGRTRTETRAEGSSPRRAADDVVDVEDISATRIKPPQDH
jgi:uncharacterized iron-regulated membrane protein